jgi:hypothetical protein
MLNKKILILAVTIIIVFLLLIIALFIFVLVSQSREKNKISSKSKEVVAAWGTYDYKTFPDTYLQNLKPLVSSDYYKKISEDKESLGKREINMGKNQYSFTATPQEILNIKKERDGAYTVTVKTIMKTSSKDTNKESVKEVRVSLKKADKEYLAYYIIAR